MTPEDREIGTDVRPARMGDAQALAGLMTQLGYPATGAEMEARLGIILLRDDYLMLVAELGGHVVGVVSNFVGYTPESDGLYGHILAMVVDERYRGRGIGAALVAESERWFREQGARFVTVTSNKRRVDAHRFYERLGYDASGLRFSKRMDVE